MKKTTPVKKKQLTPGQKAVIASKARTQALIDDPERHVNKQVAVDKIFVPPKWLKPEHRSVYREFLELVCRSKLNNISTLALNWGIARDTVYNWLTHQDTKDLVDKFIKAMAVADKALVYEMILAQVQSNAAYARLWAERYEDYQPKMPTSGNVTINFNFLDPPADKEPAKEAEYEDISK